jgi:hypothetical protein
VDSAENVLTRVTRALYPRKRPVEILAVRVKMTAETLRQVISTARAQAALQREPSVRGYL